MQRTKVTEDMQRKNRWWQVELDIGSVGYQSTDGVDPDAIPRPQLSTTNGPCRVCWSRQLYNSAVMVLASITVLAEMLLYIENLSHSLYDRCIFLSTDNFFHSSSQTHKYSTRDLQPITVHETQGQGKHCFSEIHFESCFSYRRAS